MEVSAGADWAWAWEGKEESLDHLGSLLIILIGSAEGVIMTFMSSLLFIQGFLVLELVLNEM